MTGPVAEQGGPAAGRAVLREAARTSGRLRMPFSTVASASATVWPCRSTSMRGSPLAALLRARVGGQQRGKVRWEGGLALLRDSERQSGAGRPRLSQLRKTGKGGG